MQWMKSNRLQLNASKTEVQWCAHPRRLHQLPNEPLRIGCDTVQPVQQVGNIGIFVDGGLTMAVHVEDRCMLLCCSSADTQHSTVCQQAGTTISRRITRVLSRLDYEMRLSQAFPSTNWTVCSRSSMQQHVLFTEPASTTTCLHCFRNYIGFLLLNASNTGWPYWCFVVGTTWLQSTL